MAKKKRIPNMTRAEHKRALERAAGLQAAAMREMSGQIFLPKLNRQDGDIYAQVVEAGRELLERYHSRGEMQATLRQNRIVSYYSRADVQQAIYQYATGRKISVLRNFHPMFHGSQLRAPEDILPVMMFYSQEPKLWPSIHGTVSRYDDGGRAVCDLVVEVDFKRSRIRSFNLSRPIIRLLRELGVEFRVKYSGNASPHVIIPAEAFPHKWRGVGPCRGLYSKLLDFLRNQIKEPKTLDGSFRNPDHFLRMPYSLNENTGLVSLPIRIEDYDRFSWEMARPEAVEVMEDWWLIPEDAADRTAAFIEMALGQRAVFAVNSGLRGLAKERLLPRMPDLLGAPVQMGILRAGEEIAARGAALMREPSVQDALRELSASNARDAAEWSQLAHTVSQKYSIHKQDMHLSWQWSARSTALAYYSRPDVQEALYSYARGRCVLLEGMSEYLTLNKPSDISAFAAYTVGGGIAPLFRCTNAKYAPDSGEMTACDMVIQANRDIANSVVLLFRGFDMPSFALYSGGALMWIVIPSGVLDASMGTKSSLSHLSDLATALDKHLRRMLKTSDGIMVLLYEGCTPIPYALADDGKSAYLPVKPDAVYRLSPDVALADAVAPIEKMDSFMPSDAAEKAARFINDVIL